MMRRTWKDNAKDALAAAIDKDGAAMIRAMQTACERHAQRLMLADWSVETWTDKQAWAETQQDISVMLLEMAPIRRKEGGKTVMVSWDSMDAISLYRALIGRAKRAAMTNYGVTANRAPLLTWARDEDGKRIADGTRKDRHGQDIPSYRKIYRVLSLDGMTGSSKGAERAFIDTITEENALAQDVLNQTRRLEDVDHGVMNDKAVRAILSALTKAERKALAGVLAGRITLGDRSARRAVLRLKTIPMMDADLLATVCAFIRATA